MQVDFSKILVNLNKEPLVDNGKQFTLRQACSNALLSESDKSPSTGEDKYKRWKLAGKILEASDPVEVTVEEISSIKTKVGEAFAAIVVGQVFEMLESN